MESVESLVLAFKEWLAAQPPALQPDQITEENCGSLLDAVATNGVLQRARDEIASFRGRSQGRWSDRHLYVVRFVKPIMTEYVRRTGGQADAADQLAELIHEYVRALHRERHLIQYRALMTGVALDAPVRLDADVEVRPILTEERADWELGAHANLRRILSMQPLVVALDYSVPWGTEVELHANGGHARRAVENARLVLSVLLDRRLEEPCALENTSVVPFHRSWRTTSAQGDWPDDHFRADDLEAPAQRLWRGMLGPNAAVLSLAMRRYEMSLRRDNHADPIIDSWIVLESVFSDSTSELAHKVSFRAAAFLFSGSEALEAYRDLKKSYGVRSKLVHGVSAKLDVKHIGAMRRIARAAIIGLADLNAKLEPHAIEEAVLSASQVPFGSGSAASETPHANSEDKT